ncbi:MAG: hypothetical protein H6R26_1344 [Proteobacteria bacterium]|nr:hypothetical protein [Pseudomonadota bacterium]
MIFTFYSFKGGVGRSMGMAAVGYLLAQRGLKVLAVDFDLEAPGLERYFFDEPGPLAEVRGNPGLIDLVLAYKRALTSESEFQRAEFKQWQAYIVDAIPRTPAGGSVDLMTSGRRYPEERYGEYALAVRSFDWQDFFHNWRGDRFFDWLRRELTDPERGYDAVLVDSRTGVTEMGGVCAYQLADVAVLLCAPNYQNLDGTRAVVDDFRSDAVTALRQGRPLEILVLPARVEQSDLEKRDQFLADFEEIFGTDGLPKVLADAGLGYRELAVPYQRELAIIERLADEAAATGTVFSSQSTIHESFETLTDALVLLAEGERWKTLKRDALARLTGRPLDQDAAPLADLSKRSAGYDAFIDYQAADADRVEALVQALTAAGLHVYTAHHPSSPGEDWQAVEIGRALNYSSALVVCLGHSPPGELYWDVFRQAQSLRKPIVPVLLPGCERPEEALKMHGLIEHQALDLSGGVEAPGAVDRLLEALGKCGRPAAPAETPQPIDPYPGAAPFSEDQSAVFFGRERETGQLLAAFENHDIVLLEGASGVGKTSLAHAGLCPRVRRGDGVFAHDEGTAPWTVMELDLAGSDGAARLDGLQEMPSEAPLLIVLDGIDSFPEADGDEARHARLKAVIRVLRSASARSRSATMRSVSTRPSSRRRSAASCACRARSEASITQSSSADSSCEWVASQRSASLSAPPLTA